MNIKEIKQLLNLISEHELAEFELEREGTKISIKKYSMPPQLSSPIIQTMPENYMMKASEEPPKTAEKAQKTEQEADVNLQDVVSPIVGTYYAAPSPDASAYVTTGSKVSANDTVCIIEAMKVMNEIKAEISGVVEQILVENGQAVEYGQVLFRVRK